MQPTASARPPVTIDNLTTPEAVQSVIDNPDPVIRNLQITQSYHELNLAVDRHLADANVSWCAFATWASRMRRPGMPVCLFTAVAEQADPFTPEQV